MPVPKDLTGRYIQIIHKMRYGADGGDGVRFTESKRPFTLAKGSRVFHDGKPHGDGEESTLPTYVYFETDDNINVAALVNMGGLIASPESAIAKKKRLAAEKDKSDE